MSDTLPDEVGLMTGPAALPRDNGELVFAAPWEGRTVALAVDLVERLRVPWDEFRHRLIQAISQDPDRPYYESWTVALEAMVVDRGLATAASLDAATPLDRPVL